MTDTELKRRKAICEVANVSDIGDLSDGFHTFNGLYYQRMILFAALVHAYKDRAWKSYRHEDGELCFGGGWFIVGIDTPEGSYTYHYENKDFDRFDCVELPCGKHWDGHTEDDVTRLLSLPPISPDEDNVVATEYIKRDEALSFPWANGKYDHEHANEHFIYGLETYKEWLEQLPVTLSSKVRGVGKWIMLEPEIDLRSCSVCEHMVIRADCNYCPNCGAKMEVAE